MAAIFSERIDMRRFDMRGVDGPLGELFWIVIILLGMALGLLRVVMHFTEAVSKRD
jgi:hypothetical protein